MILEFLSSRFFEGDDPRIDLAAPFAKSLKYAQDMTFVAVSPTLGLGLLYEYEFDEKYEIDPDWVNSIALLTPPHTEFDLAATPPAIQLFMPLSWFDTPQLEAFAKACWSNPDAKDQS